MNVVNLNNENVRRPQDRSQQAGFNNVYEMTQYVQGEIRASKMAYKDIAKKANVGPTTVSRLANGDTKDPRINTVIQILFALGRTLYVR